MTIRKMTETGRRAARLYGASALAAAITSMMGMTALAAGWVIENNSWHYINPDGGYATDCFKRSGDNYFYLDSNGDMVYSSIIDDGKNFYYVNSAGAMVSNEWREVENTDRYSDEEPDTWWYYLSSNGRAIKQTGSNAKVATVPTKAGNAKFIFDDLGRMMSGWIGSDGQMLSGEDAWREGVYYSDPENGGRLVVNSWAYIHAEDPENEDRDGDGYWFYFDGSGKKVTDKVNKLINGRKYRFNEYGVAHYDWYENASESSASYYYSEEEQCWLRTDWFKAIPDPERDPEGYDMGEEYWYYADKKGQIAASEIRNIRGVRYGFDEYGKMLHGLYILDMADDGDSIYINGRRIEADSDMRYEQFEYGGESYLISAAGKIMKGRTNVKDVDGYYYCTDKKGVVTYYGEERYKKQ